MGNERAGEGRKQVQDQLERKSSMGLTSGLRLQGENQMESQHGCSSCDSSIREVEAEGWSVQGQPQQRSELKSISGP